MPARVLCLLGRHLPDRERAHWNGLAFVGSCRNCGTPIRRRSHRRWERCDAGELERRFSI